MSTKISSITEERLSRNRRIQFIYSLNYIYGKRDTKYTKHTDMCAVQHIQLGRTDIKDFLDKYC